MLVSSMHNAELFPYLTIIIHRMARFRLPSLHMLAFHMCQAWHSI